MKDKERKSMFEMTNRAEKTLLGLPQDATQVEIQEAQRKQKEKFAMLVEAQRISLGLPQDATQVEIQEAQRKQKEKFLKVSEVYRISLGLSQDATQVEIQEAQRKQKEKFAHLTKAYKSSLGLPADATQPEIQEAQRKQNSMADFARRTQRAMLGLPGSATQSDVRRAIDRQQHFLSGISSTSPSMSDFSASKFVRQEMLKGINNSFNFKPGSGQSLYAKSVADNWKVTSTAVAGRNLFKLNSSMRTFESRSVRNSYTHGIASVENHVVNPRVWKEWLNDTNTSNTIFVKSVQAALTKRQSKNQEESKEVISAEVEVAATQTFIQDIPDSGNKLEVTSEELYELQGLLAKHAISKACHLPVAERMYAYFSNLKVKRQKIDIPLYHGRSRKAEGRPFVENELNSPALYGMPSHGRFNGANENLYYTSDNIEALKSELKLEKDEVYDAMEFEPEHEVGVVDLTVESQVLMSFCLQRVASSHLDVPVEYFIPTFIMQCLRDNRDVDVVKVGSAVFPGAINYIFLDIAMQRDAKADHIKIHRFLGKSSAK